MIHRIQTIDAHAAGEPLRLVVEGMPAPEGRTMLEKRAWAMKRLDHLRKALILEPRGHIDMYGALLTEPVSRDSHAGILFMHNEGWSTMCGHGIIAVTTMAIERGLIWHAVPERNRVGGSNPHDPENGGKPTSVHIRYDTPAGPVQARAHLAHHGDAVRVESVAFRNVASFVFEPSLMVPIGGRKIPVDVAFGGAFYAIVDAEAAGVPIDGEHLPELRKLGMTIAREVEKLRRVVHPNDSGLEGIYGTIFTAPAQLADAHLRNVTIFADAEVDRSPCGTGTAAVMAVLNDMGLLLDDVPFVHESIVGTTFKGRVVDRVEIGDKTAIVPEIEGSAWITGEHTFLIDGDDPLKAGFRL
ncbi:MAG TPA: proline racemase family protein, partial [Vicinamibacterales bacterium]|nr:proline racemase family protein [Vicinamibacterales bacterium]